jgi:inorganic triphosphatase YgiF
MKEIEIKLTPSVRLQLKLQKRTGKSIATSIEERLRESLGLEGFDLCCVGYDDIIDDYWDTPEFALLKTYRIFRVRKSGNGFKIAKKIGTPSHGTAIYDREEEEAELPDAEILKEMFNDFASLRRKMLPDLIGSRFRSILRVSNNRRLFKLQKGNAIFELVLDSFVYSSPSSIRTSRLQSEIEIEAKNDQARADIDALGKIVLATGVKGSRYSKYERGVRVLHLTYPSWVLNMMEWVETLPGRWVVVILGFLALILALIPLFK